MRLCPLRFDKRRAKDQECIKEDCAWWDNWVPTSGFCAVRNISVGLQMINSMIASRTKPITPPKAEQKKVE